MGGDACGESPPACPTGFRYAITLAANCNVLATPPPPDLRVPPLPLRPSAIASPRSQSTTFVRASRQTTILVRASGPVPSLPSCVPENPRHTTASPGPSSLAARLWRFFDGGVGRERTSKAIASPRAQERVCRRPEPVAFHQRCRASPSNPTPPEAAPPDPSSRTARCAGRYGRSVSEGRELRQAAAERTAAHTPTPPEGAARLPQR